MIRRNYLLQSIFSFFKEHYLIFLFILLSFLIGIIFGSIAVKILSYPQKDNLVQFLESFFTEINHLLASQKKFVIKELIFANLKFAFVFWLLGLTLIGGLVIPIIIFLRGFIIGFTVGFLIDELFFKGIILSIVAILPQNFIMIPTLLLAALITLVFTFEVTKNILRKRRYSFYSIIKNYSLMMLVIAPLLIIAALIECYITPNLINLVVDYL